MRRNEISTEIRLKPALKSLPGRFPNRLAFRNERLASRAIRKFCEKVLTLSGNYCRILHNFSFAAISRG